MEVEFVMRAEDHVAYNVFLRERLRWDQRHPWFLFVGALSGIALIWVGANVFSPERERALGAAVVIVALDCWYLYSVITWRTRLAVQFRRLLNVPANRDIWLGWRKLTISEDALRWESENATTIKSWKLIEYIAIAGDHAYFMGADKIGYLLPRRPFGSEQEFQDFVKSAKRYRAAALRTDSRRKRADKTDQPDTNIMPDEPAGR
jgi:hypothetical protein